MCFPLEWKDRYSLWPSGFFNLLGKSLVILVLKEALPALLWHNMTSEFSHLRIYVFKKVPWENCICWICVLASDHLLRIPAAFLYEASWEPDTRAGPKPQVWSPVVSSTSFISTSDPFPSPQWMVTCRGAFMPMRSKNSAPLKNISPCLEGSLSLTQHPGLYSQHMVFPVVMYRCESWITKKAECQRIDAFKLWCWRRLVRVPWTARRSTSQSQRKSALNIHWKDWCWSSNTLATWCEELSHWKRPWCWERLRAGGEEGSRGWGG